MIWKIPGLALRGNKVIGVLEGLRVVTITHDGSMGDGFAYMNG